MNTGANIWHFINYGNVGASANGDKMSFWSNSNVGTSMQGISHLTNYGTMGAIDCDKCETEMTLNNLGMIGQFNGFNIKGKFMIENYTLMVNENAETFNKSANGSLSHLVVSGNGVSFKDGNSKIILDFGSGFELEAPYKIANLASGLSVDFGRLTTKSDLFSLTQSGENFIAKLNTSSSTIGNLYKSNVRTMNNFITMSNAMIYPRKHNLVILRERSNRRISKSNVIDSSPKAQNDNIMLDSANRLKSYESFAYRNESKNRRIQRQNKRNYSRESLKSQNPKQPQNLNTDSANENNQTNPSLRAGSQNLRGNPKDLQALRSNHPNNSLRDSVNRDYHFILTPFINHNLFFESGRYNLSGFDGGFLTAFSGKLNSNNTLGAHFMMSYGSLGDSKDKDLSIKSLNLNLGLNYKLDLIWDMYLKARGDFYYFLNQAKTLTMFEAIKPNNMGFGLSVSYGKNFNFGNGGILGIEAGLDYKALQSSNVSLQNSADRSVSETYQKALYHLLYADLGINYAKYFNSSIGLWGINATLGIKGNVSANKLANSQIHINNLNRSVDMVLDNDKILGYANLGASYVLNHKNFDMEFSLAYYGSFGDRIISNAGGFEWRVVW